MSSDTLARGRKVAAQDVAQPKLGPLGWARWVWRQLTSMRTALMLLLLLAIAAVPGSVWPQRSVDPALVSAYLRNNPELGKWLDRFQMFDVFSSPWFASIYLLLMVSLIGCLVPRSKSHWRAIRAQPPGAPARLTRLPAYTRVELNGVGQAGASAQDLIDATRTVLKRHHFRMRKPSEGATRVEVAAESGYTKETGNLVFHIALLGVIISVAVGHLWGWRGEVILPENDSFTSLAAQYDTFAPGPLVNTDDLPPFTMNLDSMTVSFETEAQGAQFGAPREFSAVVSTSDGPGQPVEEERLAVNDPLHVNGASVFLLGNGYAPVVTVRDADDNVLFSDSVPFLPQDDNYTSTGAIKVAGADPELGFYGAFLPTARFDDVLGPTSDFPDLVDPQLAIGVYEGDLFPGGAPQSVYVLDTAAMEQLPDANGEPTTLLLTPGQTLALPDDRGTVTLDSVVRWGGLVVRHDPGRLPVLISAISVLVGLVLMLAVRRRRVFVRVVDGPGGTDEDGGRHTGLEVAGLVKGSDPGLQAFVERLCAEIVERSNSAIGTNPDQRTTSDTSKGN